MIKEKETTVKKILTDKAPTKDNDSLLLAYFWQRELSGNTDNVLKALATGMLSSAESITRCRRKVQEKYPELRGNSWKKRHNTYEDTVKREILEMNNEG